MKSTNQEAFKLGTKSDAVRTKLINRTTKCEALAIRGQAALAQEVVQTVDLPHPIYIDSAEGPYLTDLDGNRYICLLYTSPSPRDRQKSRMPSSA